MSSSLADRLRLALAAGPAPICHLIDEDTVDLPPGPELSGRPAAVLVPIVDRPRPTVILTLRSDKLRNHAGQVAFPGGRIDPDDHGPIAAALREAEEEIGLPRGEVAVVGLGDGYATSTGFVVTPVIGVVPPDLPLAPHEVEVAALFEVPLDFLLDPANHKRGEMQFRGETRRFFEMFWDDRRIWGMTAAMIVNIARRLATFR